MELSDIYHLAKLSRLAINEEQALSYQKELVAILDYLEKLTEPSLDKTIESTGELWLGRSDEVEPFSKLEGLIKRDKDQDFLSVPSVFKR